MKPYYQNRSKSKKMHLLAFCLAYKLLQNFNFPHGDIPLTTLITTYSHKAAPGLCLLLYSQLHHDTGTIKIEELRMHPAFSKIQLNSTCLNSVHRHSANIVTEVNVAQTDTMDSCRTAQSRPADCALSSPRIQNPIHPSGNPTDFSEAKTGMNLALSLSEVDTPSSPLDTQRQAPDDLTFTKIPDNCTAWSLYKGQN